MRETKLKTLRSSEIIRTKFSLSKFSTIKKSIYIISFKIYIEKFFENNKNSDSATTLVFLLLMLLL